MRSLRQTLLLVVALTAALLGGLFSLQNTQPIPIDLLFIRLPEQPLAIWILLAFFFGVLLGIGAGSVVSIRKLAQIRSLRKERDQLLTSMNKKTKVDPSE